MNNLKRFFLIFLLAGCSLLYAGEQWHMALQYQYSMPSGALQAWFSPSTKSYAFAIGYGDPDTWNYNIRIESMLLDKPNTDKLTYKDLHLRMEILSAALEGRYTVIPSSLFRPYLLWEAGLYRWFAERGSYTIDDPATGGEVLVPERNQSEWSWGFSAGLGTDVFVLDQLAVGINLKYRLIVGELWPALALELENVSVFQLAIANAGLTWYF